MNQPTNVIVDPQLSLATVLRPMDGFSSTYQGQDPTRPLAFFPPNPDGSYTALDAEIGTPGISQRLLKYVPVPLGARCTLYIPHVIYANGASILEEYYRYSVHWRVRNYQAMFDSVRGGRSVQPFHMQTFEGRADTTVPAAQQRRLLIPGATRSVILEQTESATYLEQNQHLRRERMDLLTTYQDSTQLPFLLNGQDGEREQGLLDPATFTAAAAENIPKASLYFPWTFVAEGDEMSIEAIRSDAYDVSPDVWNFHAGEADEAWLGLYGDPVNANTPGVGILLFVGA